MENEEVLEGGSLMGGKVIEPKEEKSTLRTNIAKVVESGKWEPTGLLEGTEGEERRKALCAVLKSTGKDVLFMMDEEGEEWGSIALPVARRVFDLVFENHEVSVVDNKFIINPKVVKEGE